MTEKHRHLFVACPVPLVMEGICLALSQLPGPVVIHRIPKVRALSDHLASPRPDLIILQFENVHADRTRFLKRMINGHASIKVIMLVPWHLLELETAACGAYCKAILPQNIRSQELREAVAQVLEHGRYMRAAQTDTPPIIRAGGLTQREAEVVRWMAKGMRTSEIAARLGASPNTIQTHRRNILRKLGARTTAQLMITAQQIGIL